MLDIKDLNESTKYYRDKLNEKVVKKFNGKKFNKLNTKHLEYLSDSLMISLTIFIENSFVFLYFKFLFFSSFTILFPSKRILHLANIY